MKVVNPSIERLKTEFSYNQESGMLTRKSNEKVMVSKNSLGYYRVSVGPKWYPTHRVIWAMFYGEWPRKQIDHIDLDRTNNRIENLREATNSENQQNKGKQKNNTSGMPGVYWYKNKRLWHVCVKLNRKLYSFGYFKDKEDAIKQRLAAKALVHKFEPRQKISSALEAGVAEQASIRKPHIYTELAYGLEEDAHPNATRRPLRG